ncbi:MAG: SigE family RNA polymerase sigma factor [Actinobacteria bacterium]|nr:SigE family RNA polymerase sigma factor [Actinomycetota bacterium]
MAAFVHARGLALVRFAVALCGDRVLGEDLVQEALAKVVRRFGRRIEVERPEAYLRQVVVREFLQWRRRHRPVADLAEVPDVADAVGTGEPDQRDAMWRFLAGLPKRQRAVLVLGFYEDLPDDEIAALMGCSTGTVRSQRLRALRALKLHPGLAEVADAVGHVQEVRHD